MGRLYVRGVTSYCKITNFTHNSLEEPSFPGVLEGTKSLVNCKKNSQGIIFVIISCQGVWTSNSGKKKEHKTKLLGLGTFRWGRGLPRERVGAKKFGMCFETQGNRTLGRDIPGFQTGYPGICAHKV